MIEHHEGDRPQVQALIARSNRLEEMLARWQMERKAALAEGREGPPQPLVEISFMQSCVIADLIREIRSPTSQVVSRELRWIIRTFYAVRMIRPEWTRDQVINEVACRLNGGKAVSTDEDERTFTCKVTRALNRRGKPNLGIKRESELLAKEGRILCFLMGSQVKGGHAVVCGIDAPDLCCFVEIDDPILEGLLHKADLETPELAAACRGDIELAKISPEHHFEEGDGDRR